MTQKKIRFRINADFLENDVRSLFMAFYPGAQITREDSFSDADGEWDLSGEVSLSKDGTLVICLTEGERAFCREDAVCHPEDKKECRTKCKCLLYRMIEQLTGISLPWGTLTGIRPTKIVRTMLSEGETKEAAASYMTEKMLCSPEKTNLSLEIAQRELELLKKVDYKDGYSLYLGIPFCPTTCAYCSFTSYPLSRFASETDRYLDALEREIRFAAERFADKKLNTIYIGGGTPTTLSPEQLDRLLTLLETSFDRSALREWTVEAGRPDSITREKLQAIKKHPVTRISINPQTMKEETLKLIGRKHTVAQVKEAFALAREEGFDNINMDIIVGLPDETPEDVVHTLEEIGKLGPDSLTVHSLAIKRAARLNTQKEAFSGNISVNTTQLMDLTEMYARKMGLFPYYLYRQKNMTGNLENVGYAAPGREGVYNILIMEEVQTILALGAGAVTKAVFGDRIERCENVKDIRTYLDKLDEMLDRKKKLFHFL